WALCLAELASARARRPGHAIGDQVRSIWSKHGFYSTPVIPKEQAHKIWVLIPNSGLKARPICNAASITVGSFVGRVLRLSNGR
ncbi:MAG: hypothetical protein AAB448_04190, partial [Patescibacteria group bacterium]